MTLLDVIDFDKIWTVKSMWENKFFWAMGESGRVFDLEFMRKSKLNFFF